MLTSFFTFNKPSASSGDNLSAHSTARCRIEVRQDVLYARLVNSFKHNLSTHKADCGITAHHFHSLHSVVPDLIRYL